MYKDRQTGKDSVKVNHYKPDEALAAATSNP
jgi:hypothetical protein